LDTVNLTTLLPPSFVTRLVPNRVSAQSAPAPKEKKEKAAEPERERKPLQHDEPTSDEWAAGGLGRPAGALETKEWGETIFSAPK
jgi:lysyl-tRNA synthetase class 2